MTLKEFVEAWNESHKRFIFSVYDNSGVNRPTSVEIRYPAVRYKNFYSTDNWNRLNDMVDALSHGTMFIVSNEYLYEPRSLHAIIITKNSGLQELCYGLVKSILMKKNFKYRV